MTDDVAPSPDELLLEMIDLVALALPWPYGRARVVFAPSEDGSRPALTDVGGDPIGDAPARPDLGHDARFVDDALNSLLVELADATQRQAGLRVLDGRIDVERSNDACDVFLIERGATAAADRVKMQRRFDRDELSLLFFTPALYEALARTVDDEQRAKAALDAELARFARFSIDMGEGTIAFSSDAETRTYPFQLVGSWSDESRRFLWGWGNEQIAPSLREGVEALRRSSEEIRAFQEPDVGGPEPMAERLARHAAATMRAKGLYRAPFKSLRAKGFMYLALF